MRTRSIAAVAALLTLTGCAPSDYSDHRFVSLAELAETVEWDCALLPDEEETKATLDEHGWASAPCAGGSIVVFASDAMRDELWSLPQNALGAGECRVEGGNWSVRSQQFAAEEAHERLGGEITCA